MVPQETAARSSCIKFFDRSPECPWSYTVGAVISVSKHRTQSGDCPIFHFDSPGTGYSAGVIIAEVALVKLTT
jgi:hypothetical protein